MGTPLLMGAGSFGAVYDPATKAIYNAISTPPGVAFESVLNTAIITLKSNSAFSALDWLNVVGMPDQQASTLNWIDPTKYVATDVAPLVFSPYWGLARNGGVGNGYRNSNFNPKANAVQASQNAACFWVYTNYQKAYTGTSHYYGAQNDITTANQAFMRSQFLISGVQNVSGWLNMSNNATNFPDSSNGIGILMVEKVNSTTVKIYFNNTLLGTQTITSTDLVNLKLFLLGLNYDGSYFTSPQEDQVYAAGFGNLLTSQQKTDLLSALSTFRQQNLLTTATKTIDTNKVTTIFRIGESTGTPIFINSSSWLGLNTIANVFNWNSSHVFENYIIGSQDDYAHTGSGNFTIDASNVYKLSTTYGRKVRNINQCVGGTTVYPPDNQWNIGGADYNVFIAQALLMLAATPEPTNNIICCFTIGANDAADATKAAGFQTNCQNTINGIRTALSLPNLKFILNRLSSNLNEPFASTVNAGIDAIVAADPTRIFSRNLDTMCYRTDLHHPIDACAEMYGYLEADIIDANLSN